VIVNAEHWLAWIDDPGLHGHRYRVSGVSVVVCDTTNQRAVTLTPHDTLIDRP